MIGPGPSASPPPPSRAERLRSYLSRHPILCLALLTPGIPEYLSGSSSPIGLLLAPPVFALFLLANLGLYTAGVLLIREARVRWHLGWAAVLTLGVAYGIAEEGLALDTLYDLHAGPVDPATAVHLLGVNWGWASQILPFHALYSVALPILLLDLALPGTRGRPLLGARGLAGTAAAYVATVAVLGVAIARTTYWMGTFVLLGTLLVLAGLLLLARALPPDAGSPAVGPPRTSRVRLFGLGLGTFPGLIVLPAFLAAVGLPAPLLLEVAPLLALAAFCALQRSIGTVGAEAGAVAFGAGLIVPLLVLGAVVALRFPPGLLVVGVVDGIAGAFLWRLYRRYSEGSGVSLPRIRPVAG